MRVLVACEFSGVVRNAFLARGHDAYSCDVLPTVSEPRDRHYWRDVTPLLREPWDLVIAHPPCTYLAGLGARWFKDDPMREVRLREGCDFFRLCLNANAPRVCVENPTMLRRAMERIGVRWTQRVQPYMFGVGETKATYLWLKGLPSLLATKEVKGRFPKSHWLRANGIQQGLLRSITCQGVADAMADQWGSL